MCQSYRQPCACGAHTAEIFFRDNVFNAAVLTGIFCPTCGAEVPRDPVTTVEDNGWVLTLDPTVFRAMAERVELDAENVTADQLFEQDYVTWVGFTPEDGRKRLAEQDALAKRHAGDRKAHFLALRQWAQEREKILAAEGWRKARRASAL